jgi:adenylate cyclase
VLEQQPQERRLVTVLFADFAGFTELADQMDPEELQVLVSGIFEDLAEEAVRHDGTIEKFIGDAIFVVFGAPVAHEDDPQRALRTALAMQRVFADHAARVKKERGVEFGLRIGIHTGMVVAGAVRSVAEYGVMGDTVNVASRLQSVAGPGEIYVTQTTFRLTNREFSFREVGPIELKGKDKPILAYALIGERTDVRPSIEIAAPLVGRWMELSRLDLAYQSARLGRTELVLIAGEPGIGKSRLVSEFIGLATAAEEGAKSADAPRVMRWTFSRVNQRSYAGFIEPILVELNIQPADPEAITRVGEKLLELGFTNPGPAVAPMLAQFLHLPGVNEPASDSEEWKRSMYIVVYDVIAALARQHPLLYVLEDLHFADAASLDLLWFLTSRASRVPILFLLAQRLGPGSPEPKPSRTNYSQLVLEPLSDEEAARIVEATLDWVPDELRDRIVARAGGNPFFIEESLRSLVESGAAEKDASGEWHLRERPAALEVPATLHAVVASRIDRLPPTARDCIQLAAVIGTRFGDRVLREAGGDRIADAVDQLIAADLVLEAAPGERREGRYRFKHAVVQEVAYNTLLVRRRVELHRRVAAAYEKVLGEELKEFYPALAHHYLIGDVPDKAAEYSWKSAQRATAIHAYIEALRFAEQALELYEKINRIDAAVEALYLIARVRRYRGENDAALTAYERALGLLETRDPKSGEVAIVLAHMAELCTRWDAKHPDLEGLIERGLAIVGDAKSRERVLLLAAKSFMPRRGPKSTDADWEASLATAKEALAIAEELGLLRERSLCLDAVGYAHRELGNFREAYLANQRRLPIAQSLQDSDELIDAHTMVAICALSLGDMHEAMDHAASAREVAIETEKPRLGAHALRTETLAHLLAGDFPGTIAAAARRERFATPTKWPSTLSVAIGAAAAMSSPEEKVYRDLLIEQEASPAELALADFLAAYYGLRESESAYHAVRSAGQPKSIVDLTMLGPLLVLAGARWRVPDEAFEDRVAAVVERTSHARGRALLTHAEAIRSYHAGEHAKAAKLLFDAVQAFATLKLDYERAVALADLARALQGVPGREDQAQAQCDEAKAIAERLSATALRVAAENLTVRV